MIQYLKFILLSLICILTLSCAQKEAQQSIDVYLMLSVDWEGDTLREANLNALKEFNKRYPQYPVIHFINPAYYTKTNFLTAQEINKKTRSVIKANDEIGLHIHAWENLIKASGVNFREGPSFWGPKSLGRGGERGDDVPLNLYSQKEIYKIIQFSLKILEKNGFKAVNSFRGGGWMSGPKVYQALIRSGIHVDSSAVPYQLVEKLYPNTGLAKMIKRDWSEIDIFSFPYTPKGTQGKLVQFPNNTGLADYVDADDFFSNYLLRLKKAKASGKKEIYIHYGWHQESAVEYFEHKKEGGTQLVQAHFLRRVKESLRRLEEHAKENDHNIIPVTFKTFPDHLVR